MKTSTKTRILTTATLSGLLGLLDFLPASGEDEAGQVGERRPLLELPSAQTADRRAAARKLASLLAPEDRELEDVLDARLREVDGWDDASRFGFMASLARVLSAQESDMERKRLLQAFQAWCGEVPDGSGAEGFARFPDYIAWLAKARARLADGNRTGQGQALGETASQVQTTSEELTDAVGSPSGGGLPGGGLRLLYDGGALAAGASPVLAGAEAGAAAPAHRPMLPAAGNATQGFNDPPSRHQGQIGDCWAFASVGLLENAIFERYGVQVHLSEGDGFVRFAVTHPELYDRIADVLRRSQGTGRTPTANELRMGEGRILPTMLDLFLRNGLATDAAAPYPQVRQRYEDSRRAEIATLQGIARDTADYAPPGSNAAQRWYYNTLVPFIYNATQGGPGRHWATLQTSPASRAITTSHLLGGPQNAARLAEERGIVRQALEGVSMNYRNFGSGTDGTGQRAWLMEQLAARRPVAVGMDIQQLPEWGNMQGHAYHAFTITGYRTGPDGRVTFQTRNSWGGDNPGIPEPNLPRIREAMVLTPPREASSGAPQALRELDPRNPGLRQAREASEALGRSLGQGGHASGVDGSLATLLQMSRRAEGWTHLGGRLTDMPGLRENLMSAARLEGLSPASRAAVAEVLLRQYPDDSRVVFQAYRTLQPMLLGQNAGGVPLDLRLRAGSALLRKHPGYASQVLQPLLTSSDTRDAAFRVLRSAFPAALPESLRDDSGRARDAELSRDARSLIRPFAQRLGELERAQGGRASLLAFPTPDSDSTLAALSMASQLGTHDAVELMRAGLGHRDPQVRIATARALASTAARARASGENGLADHAMDTRHTLLALAMTDPSPAARGAAASALSTLCEPRQDILRMYMQALPQLGLSLPQALRLSLDDGRRYQAVSAGFQDASMTYWSDPDSEGLRALRTELAALRAHPNEFTRVQAAGMLLGVTQRPADGFSGGNGAAAVGDAVQTLRGVLDTSRDPSARVAAALWLQYAIQERQRPVAVASLAAVAGSERAAPHLRRAALFSLHSLAPEHELFRSPSVRVLMQEEPRPMMRAEDVFRSMRPSSGS